MQIQKCYPELLKLAKQNDYNAYNELCTEFLGYVPLILKDIGIMFDEIKIDAEDLHQEGYLAICESLQKMIKSDKAYTTNEISDEITQNIIGHMYIMWLNELSHSIHETNKVICYDDSDSFQRYLVKIREESKYRIVRDNLIKAYRFNDNPKIALQEKVILMMLLPEKIDMICPIKSSKKESQELIDYVKFQLDRCVFFTYKTSLKDLLNY